MTERKSLPLMRTVVAVLAAGAVLLLAYVAGYFWLGTKNTLKGDGPVPGPVPVVTGVVRLYPRKWQVTAFQPAAYVESLCRGVEVALGDFGTYGDPRDVEEP